MLCFRVKGKLYDFIEGNLSKAGIEKVRVHLDKCSNCAEEYEETKQLLGLVSQKKIPESSSEFWANFDRELNERLVEERGLTQEVIKLRPQYLPRISLKPAFAVACVFVLLFALSFYLFGGLPTKGRLIALADERLTNDVEILEELTDEFVVLDKDFLLNELDLLEELS